MTINEFIKKYWKIVLFFTIAFAIVIIPTVVPDYVEPPLTNGSVHYEYLDNGSVLHMWNRFNHYYIDTQSGIQLTNHYEEYWTHNVFCGGYNDSGWNWICNDELPFNWMLDSDNATYIRYMWYRDFSIRGKDYGVSFTYHLTDDDMIEIIPKIQSMESKALDINFAFRWRIEDIRINMNYTDNYYLINNTIFDADTSVSFESSGIEDPQIVAYWAYPDNQSKEFLMLHWENELPYHITIQNESGQVNAPIELTLYTPIIQPLQQFNTTLRWVDEVTIDGGIYDSTDEHGMSPSVVFVNSTTGYTVFADSTGSGDLYYRMSKDGGTTWSTSTVIHTVGGQYGSAIWYDRWTNGDTGDTIHICSMEDADDDIHYYNIDATTGTVGGYKIISYESSLVETDGGCSITKTPNGYLYAGGATGPDQVLAYSINDGDTWTEITPTGQFDDDDDYFSVYGLAGSYALVIYADAAFGRLYWSIHNGTEWLNDTIQFADFNALNAIHSDGGGVRHPLTDDFYFVFNEDYDGDGPIHLFKFTNDTHEWTNVFNFTGGGGPTYGQASLAIDAVAGHLYMVYSKGGNTAEIYYRKSTDYGESWGDETVLTSIADDLNFVKTNYFSDEILYLVTYNDDTNAMYGQEIITVNPALSWDDDNLSTYFSFKDGGNQTWDAQIDVNWTNTNVALTCVAGNCSYFDHNLTETTLYDGHYHIQFECDDSVSADLSAIFNLSSDQNDIQEQIEMGCFFWDYGKLNVKWNYPTEHINVTRNTLFDMNATVICQGDGIPLCANVFAYARYNESANPDTNINTTEGGTPFYTIGNNEVSDSYVWSSANTPGLQIDKIKMIGSSTINVTINISNSNLGQWDINISLWNYTVGVLSWANNTIGTADSSVQSVTLGDMDADGDLDVVSGDIGWDVLWWENPS